MRGKLLMDVQGDAMAVTVCVLSEGETEITEQLLRDELAARRVKAGINDEMLAFIPEGGIFNQVYQIAVGTPAISGETGYYEFFFERDAEEFVPTIRDDGSVDYSPSIQLVEKGAKVAEYHPARQGSFGYTVFDEKIAPPPSKDLPALRCVNVAKTGNEYYAGARGRISLCGDKIEICSNLTVEGDAGYSMGTIDFNGDVTVNGDVLTDVVIRAGGNVAVEGVVEGAKITAGGNIVVRCGVHGKNKAVLEAGGNITCNFIEEAKVTAGGDISVDYMVNTRACAKQTILATGKNGQIIGGEAFAEREIDAFSIGNDAGARTRIAVDSDEVDKQSMTKVVVRRKIYEGTELSVNGVAAKRLPVFGELHNVDGEVKWFEIGKFYVSSKSSVAVAKKATDKENKCQKPLVLIVDDDPVVLRTEYSYLCEEYRVAAVASPRDALIFLKRNKPDLVLLDYMMPRMNGGELLEKIREDNDREVANVSVFFLTSVTDKSVVTECLKLYPQGYLIKPLSKDELIKIVGEFFDKNHA